MKRTAVSFARILIFLFILLTAHGCQKPSMTVGDEETVLQGKYEKIAYGTGLRVGRDLRQKDLDLNLELLLRGLQDGMNGGEPLLTEEEVEQVRQAFIEERLAARRALAERNRVEGEAFLRENAAEEGVETLPSGLQYRVLEPGDGGSPDPEDNIKAHYIVKSIDGTELDSTYDKEQAAVFPVSGIIPAWTEALPLMKEGAKWELFVPASLAYGEKGVGNAVGPNQALIFEVEIISIH